MKKISFSPPDISSLEIDSVIKTLKSGWITTGPVTKDFEKNISSYCLTSKTVCLNSWTSAMELVLRLIGIGPDDEVITSAYTYTASASIIHHVGAKIVLVDTLPGSWEMDYEALKSKITSKTKAIIPVDIGGILCNYDKIFEIIEKSKKLYKPSTNLFQKYFNRILILADAAHSFGAMNLKAQRSGNIADFTAFSFHAVKNLTTGEGGAVTWRRINDIDDDFIYKQFQLLSLHGQDKDALAKSTPGAWEYDIKNLGYKCNMTDIMASIGNVQLLRYEELINKRIKIYNIYIKGLNEKKMQIIRHNNSAYHLLMVRINNYNETQRNNLILKLASLGISCNVHYKPLPLFTAYKELGFKIEDFPNAYEFYKNEITLPFHTLLSDDDVNYIINSLNENV